VARTKQPGRGSAYVGTIAGASVSIAANIAHSFLPPDGAPAGWHPAPVAIGLAVVWPVFLFLAIEVSFAFAGRKVGVGRWCAGRVCSQSPA
jgi:hypothetical protein